MYILADNFRKAILYRCEKVEVLRALANIELAHTHVHIWEETNAAAYALYAVEGLQDLFKSLTGGVDPHSHNRDYLIGQIMRLCQTATITNVNGFEVTVQSLQLKPTDRDHYRYVKGTPKPLWQAEPYNPPPLLGNWKAAQDLPLPTGQTYAPAPVQAPQQAKSWEVAPTVSPPKYAPPWAR